MNTHILKQLLYLLVMSISAIILLLLIPSLQLATSGSGSSAPKLSDTPSVNLHRDAVGSKALLLNTPIVTLTSVGQITGGPAYQAIQASGNYVYALIYAGGLLDIIDVSDPTNPLITGTLDLPFDDGHDLWYGEWNNTKYVFTGHRFGGISMVDVSNPAAPTLLSQASTLYIHKGLQSRGHYLYYSEHHAGAGPGGLRIYDFASGVLVEQGNLLQAFPCAIDGNELAVRSDGFRVYQYGQAHPHWNEETCGGPNKKLIVYDTAIPTVLTITNIFTPPNLLLLDYPDLVLAPDDSHLYIAHGDDGLLVYDVSVSDTMTLMSTASITAYEVALDTDTNLLYVSGAPATDTLYILDVQNPISPSIVGRMFDVAARDIWVDGDHLYATSEANKLLIYELLSDVPATTGTIILQKQTIPADVTDQFTFTGHISGTIGDDGQIVVPNLTAGSYTATEVAQMGWSLAAISCDDVDSSGDLASRTVTFQLSAGETVTCIFNNEAQLPDTGTIIVQKQISPTGLAGQFTFSGDVGGTIGDGEQLMMGNLSPGTYSATETFQADWNLAAITCDDDNSSANIATRTAIFQLEANETIICTFINEPQPSAIIVKKMTIPAGQPDHFTFLGDVSGMISDEEMLTTTNLLPGIYASTELQTPHWTLQSIDCDDDNSTGNIATRAASFHLAAGELVTCTFTNLAQPSTIIIQKETDPDGATTLFHFSGAISGTIGDGGQLRRTNVSPGVYVASEEAINDWQVSTIDCDDSNSSGDIESGTVTFRMEAGEIVTCTFVNHQEPGTIVVQKQTVPASTSGIFTFSGYISGSIGANGQIVVSDLSPGIYTTTEILALKWHLTALICDDDNSVADVASQTATFHLEAGELVTCTFTNTVEQPPTESQERVYLPLILRSEQAMEEYQRK